MNSKKTNILLITILLLISNSLSSNLKVISQESGLMKVNSYLIFDINSSEAAIIDPGGEIKSLLKVIKTKKLILKFIFLTHAHQDHISGLKILREKFPQARTAFSHNEWIDFKHYLNWGKIFPQEMVDRWSSVPQVKNLMNFDYAKVKKPELFIQNKTIYKLGQSTITAYNTPGHSRGSISLITDDCVFSGDLILYNKIGTLPYFLCSKENLIYSARLIYKICSEDSILYPGHGPSSKVGIEKKDNKNVSLTTVNWN